MWTLTLQPWKPRDISHKPKGHRRYVNRPVAITNCWTMVSFSNPGPGGMSKPSKSIELEEIRRKLSSCWLIPQERTCWNANIQWTPRPRSCAGQWLLGSLQREGELCQRAWRLVVFKPLAICHYTQNTLLGSLKQNHKFCCHITCVFWKGPLGEPEHWEQFLSVLWVIFFMGLSSTINGLSHPFFSGYGSNPAKKTWILWQDVKNWS